MKIILATGIYPPDIGGPATYVRALAEELVNKNAEVIVVTYEQNSEFRIQNSEFSVIRVAKSGGPLLRWWRYAAALKKYASDADIVYAFSSVSCGVPLILARLKKPKKMLRLGGDFFWERYTDRGGKKSLRHWHASHPFSNLFTKKILNSFHHIVFSSLFQQSLYEEHFRLPRHSVIENAVPSNITPNTHTKREPFRLLVMSRLVRFKNIASLVKAMALIPDVLLTIVGDGPQKQCLQRLIHTLQLDGRVAFTTPLHGGEKQEIFRLHELFVVPSLTDISPNAALEACASGLPVLLTKETGLSDRLTKGMFLKDLKTPEQIATAIQDCQKTYPSQIPDIPSRSWSDVCDDHMQLFQS